MSRWNVKAWGLLVLGIVVFFMLAIVVLPDVDLPDTAFHQGTAPLMVQARARSVPAVIGVAEVIESPRIVQLWESDRDPEFVALNLDPNFRPILLRSIRR